MSFSQHAASTKGTLNRLIAMPFSWKTPEVKQLLGWLHYCNENNKGRDYFNRTVEEYMRDIVATPELFGRSVATAKLEFMWRQHHLDDSKSSTDVYSRGIVVLDLDDRNPFSDGTSITFADVQSTYLDIERRVHLQPKHQGHREQDEGDGEYEISRHVFDRIRTPRPLSLVQVATSVQAKRNNTVIEGDHTAATSSRENEDRPSKVTRRYDRNGTNPALPAAVSLSQVVENSTQQSGSTATDGMLDVQDEWSSTWQPGDRHSDDMDTEASAAPPRRAIVRAVGRPVSYATSEDERQLRGPLQDKENISIRLEALEKRQAAERSRHYDEVTAIRAQLDALRDGSYVNIERTVREQVRSGPERQTAQLRQSVEAPKQTWQYLVDEREIKASIEPIKVTKTLQRIFSDVERTILRDEDLWASNAKNTQGVHGEAWKYLRLSLTGHEGETEERTNLVNLVHLIGGDLFLRQITFAFLVAEVFECSWPEPENHLKDMSSRMLGHVQEFIASQSGK